MAEIIEQYQRFLQLRNLAPRTIKIYFSIVARFLEQHPEPLETSNDDIITFALQGNASRTREQTIGALQHLFKGVYNQPKRLEYILKVKREEYLPDILSVDEMQRIFRGTKNLKHKAILSLIYYGALRISEAVNLKIEQIDKSGIIKIVQSKGAKDRKVPLNNECMHVLRMYYKKYKPKLYLFNGQNKPTYSDKSIQKILKAQLTKQCINKNVTVHGLRHSRATHLLDAGMDIKFLKELLGHTKIETTERYTHLTTTSLQQAIDKADRRIAA